MSLWQKMCTVPSLPPTQMFGPMTARAHTPVLADVSPILMGVMSSKKSRLNVTICCCDASAVLSFFLLLFLLLLFLEALLPATANFPSAHRPLMLWLLPFLLLLLPLLELRILFGGDANGPS